MRNSVISSAESQTASIKFRWLPAELESANLISPIRIADACLATSGCVDNMSALNECYTMCFIIYSQLYVLILSQSGRNLSEKEWVFQHDDELVLLERFLKLLTLCNLPLVDVPHYATQIDWQGDRSFQFLVE